MSKPAIEDLTRLIEEIEAKQPKGPRIDCKTEIWANLTTHALNGEELTKIEESTGKDVLWNELFEFGDSRDDEGCLLIVNSPKLETYLSLPILTLQTYRRPYNIVTSCGIKITPIT
jgi:hypothetical protein